MFISHPDFHDLQPINVYHKEFDENGVLIFDRHDESHPINKDHPKELKNKHILFRKSFTAPKFEKAVIKITADDYYKLYINGSYVTEGPSPGYHTSYYYGEIDVSDYLKEGENVIAVHTFYQGLINRVWVSGDLREMLWCELSLDGEKLIETDESWKTAYHTGYSECGMFGYETNFAEIYDARAREADFYKPEFDDSYFAYAKAHKNPEWSLIKQTSCQIELYDMLPEKIEDIDGGVRIYLSTEAVGMLAFTACGKAGDEITLRYGEELSDDGSVRYDMRCNCRYVEKMILGDGECELIQFDYKAFRYAEILYPAGVTLNNVRMKVRHYPFSVGHEYKTDNEKLRAVLDLCINTVKYSTQERFLDCPTREKGAYLGDLMVSGRSHAALTGDLTLLRHALESFTHSSFICGGLMATSGGSIMQEIADYSLEFPAILNWMYSIDGDIEYLRKNAKYSLGIYEFYKRYENSEGLLDRVIEWNLVDWPDNLRDGYDFPLTRPVGYGTHNVICALWYGLKLALTETFKILGEERDFELEKTKNAFIKTFYNEKTGLYVDAVGSQHSAVHSSIFPLLFGIGCEDDSLKARLVSHIKEKKLTSMGVYMAYFTLAALKNAGEEELCISLATDEAAWLNMIKEGATLTFEAWGKDQKWNTSLCHPWATAPLIIFNDMVRAY